MGVLDIRLRSASLGNYGSTPAVQAPNLMRVASILNEGEAARANARIQGLDRLGKLAGFAINAYSQMQEREDDRKLTASGNDVQLQYDQDMKGDGDGTSGAMNQQFTDGEAWLKDNKDLYNKRIDEAAKKHGLNSRQKQALKDRLAGYERSWLNIQTDKANKVYNSTEKEGVDTQVRNTERTLSTSSDPKSNPQAWSDWTKAVEAQVKAYERQGLIRTPEAREEMWRSSAARVLGNEMNRRVGEISQSAQVTDSENPEDVGKYFDAKIDEVKKNPMSLIPDDPKLKSVVGNDAESYGKDYVKSLEQMKKSAMHNATARRRAKSVDISQASQANDPMWVSGEDQWNAMSAGQRADSYKLHLESDSGYKDDKGNPMTWKQAYEQYAPSRGRFMQNQYNHWYNQQVRQDEAAKAAAGKAAKAAAKAAPGDSPYARDGQEDARWGVEMNQRMTNGEDTAKLIAELDANQGKVTASHYRTLWEELAKKRDANNVRIRDKVFSSFLQIGEDTFRKAANTDDRYSKESKDAVKLLLGSSNAEYVKKDVLWNPDFKIEDVDAAVKCVEGYLKAHPGDEVGADKLLHELVDPANKRAAADEFRVRILQLNRKKTFDFNEAYR